MTPVGLLRKSSAPVLGHGGVTMTDAEKVDVQSWKTRNRQNADQGAPI